MQCSAARPTWSASAAVRPLSSSTRWKSCGPSPGRHAGPDRGVRVHPLAGRGARQQLQEHLQVPPGRHDLLDAHHGDQRLAAGSGTSARCPRTRPRTACRSRRRAKLAPQIADLGRQELAAQVLPGGLGQLRPVRRSDPGRRRPSRAGRCRGSRRGSCGSPGPGCATAGRGRAARSARPGRSRRRAIPAASSASLRPISWVAIDLTLTTSVAPVAWTSSVTIALASSASRAQCTTPPRAVTSASSCSR